jgi:hypothetical protein
LKNWTKSELAIVNLAIRREALTYNTVAELLAGMPTGEDMPALERAIEQNDSFVLEESAAIRTEGLSQQLRDAVDAVEVGDWTAASRYVALLSPSGDVERLVLLYLLLSRWQAGGRSISLRDRISQWHLTEQSLVAGGFDGQRELLTMLLEFLRNN